MLFSLRDLTIAIFVASVVASPRATPSPKYKRSGGPTPSSVHVRAYDGPSPHTSAVYDRADKAGPSPVYQKRDGDKSGLSPLYNGAEKSNPSPIYHYQRGNQSSPSPVSDRREDVYVSPRGNAEPKPSAVYLNYTKRGDEPGPEPSGKYQEKRLYNEQIVVQTLCPDGLTACPVEAMSYIPNTLHEWEQIPYDCIELDNDLKSCGGCSSFDEVHDCTLISQARSVSCSAGKCRVHTCAPGYQPSRMETMCVPV